MANSGHRGQRGRQVDTEDRVMEAIAGASSWVDENRRIATIGLVAVIAVIAAGFVYLNYRADLKERAAVRLDEILLTSRNSTPAQLRTQLSTYIEQFGSTHQADEARLLLAEQEISQDSVARAIELIDPVVDLDVHPLGYNAGWMMAVAQEQLGDREAAASWYDRLADAARHDYQRRRAQAASARLYEYAGDYGAAEEIYAELAAQDDAADDQDFYGVKLGEVMARSQTDAAPPSVPQALEPTENAPAASDTAVSGGAAEAPTGSAGNGAP